MGPLTRNRAGEGLAPSPFAAEYYAERASAGLIIADPDLRHRQQDME